MQVKPSGTKRLARTLSAVLLALLAVAALLAPWLASGLPLEVEAGGRAYTLRSHPQQAREAALALGLPSAGTDWRCAPEGKALFAPIPYSPGHEDQAFLPPGALPAPKASGGPPIPRPERFRHWLGTDHQGRDVLANLIWGCRGALQWGTLVTLIAFAIGISVGAAAGYWGARGLHIRRGRLAGAMLGLIPAWFYGFALRRFELADAFQAGAGGGALLLSLLLALAAWLGVLGLGLLAEMAPWFRRQARLSPDAWLLWLIQTLDAMPLLLILMALAAVYPNMGTGGLMSILALLGWPRIAAFTRAEVHRVATQDHVVAARAMGYGEARILLRHVLPHVLAPALSTAALVFGSTILLEATLSFLGLTQDAGGWGSIIGDAQLSMIKAHYWTLLFPAALMLGSVLSLQVLAEALREWLAREGRGDA